MQTLVRNILKWTIRLLLKPVLSGWMPFAIQRGWARVMMLSSLPPRGMRSTPVSMDGIPAARVDVGEAASNQPGAGVILFLHGGGYCVGSVGTHSPLTAHVARATGATCFLPEYRLAPEHPYPAALEDALKAYRWLLAQGHKSVALAGDSAGGGLALATALSLRDTGLPIPVALLLISPWVDLTLSGATAKTHASRDPMLSRSIGELWARSYLGGHAANDPLCSPLFARLEGLPPMLIQVGSEEILLDDSRRLEQRARAAGVTVQLHEYAGMWHDFQIHAGVLDESNAAMAETGKFLKPLLAGRPASA